MTNGILAVIHPVRDLASAKPLYTALLGVEPDMDQPYYVNFRVGSQDIGLDPNGHAKGMTGPVVYWQVDDIAAQVDALVATGAKPQQKINDVGGGKLVATVVDADGNAIGLMQPPVDG
jgi:predicted enzyme related to lactoylglutathione lyase